MGIKRIWMACTVDDGDTCCWRGRSGWVAEPGARVVFSE